MREWRNPLFFFEEDVVPDAGIPQIVWRERGSLVKINQSPPIKKFSGP